MGTRAPDPEPDPSPEAISDYGIRNRNLPKMLVNAILDATREAQQQERWQRLREVLEDCRNRLYDMGIQHLYVDRNFCWSQAFPGASYTMADGSEDVFGDYIGDYNIFTAYALIQQAKISEPEVGVDFQAINPDNSDDRESAAAAEGIRQQYDIDVDSKDIVQKQVYFTQMGGRSCQWTRTEDEAAPYGVTSDGKPRRRFCTTVGGVLEWKIPIFANDRKDCGYAIYYDDPDLLTAQEDYHWVADNLTAGGVCLAETSYERISRLSVVMSQQDRRWGWTVGEPFKMLITRGNVWLRLSRFRRMNDIFVDDDGNVEVNPETGEEMTVREKMADVFPNGVHAVIVGQQYCESWDASLDKEVTITRAYIGKGMSLKPIMREMILVQDAFNQMVNQVRETQDFCVPATWVNSDACEYDAITKQRARPGAYHPMKELPPGLTIADCIYREEPFGIPSDFMKFIEFMQSNLPQFQLAVPPSVWGGTENTKVAELYQASAMQAMGIIGKFRTRIVATMAEIYYQACLAASADEAFAESITVPVPGQKGRSRIVRKDSLRKGNFRCYPDQNSGFPETTAQQRQSLERIVAQLAPTPMAGQIYSDPANIAEMIRVSGVKLRIPEAESWAKQSREIDILLASAPKLKSPQLVQMMAEGASVQTMVDAIVEALKQAQQEAQQALMAQVQGEAEKNYAAQRVVADVQRLPDPAKPPAPPMPQAPPPKLASIAQSTVPVRISDFNPYEANKCQDYLSSPECWNEETVGRIGDDGESRPNIAGVLNVTLHWMEHLERMGVAPGQTPPLPSAGPLPAVGSPPAPTPMPGIAA